MASAPTASAFAFLHAQIKAAFGTGRKAWFPATRPDPRATTAPQYTVGVSCAIGPITARAVEDSGLASIPTDGVTIQATRDEFPFEPRANDVFILGADATGRKYIILSVMGSEDVHSHYRIIAQRH